MLQLSVQVEGGFQELRKGASEGGREGIRSKFLI
jgi:hypothetical protein